MKIGIMGLGKAGMRHFDNARALGHEVNGYDIAQENGGKKVAHSQRRNSLFDWAEAVIIATPSECHLDDLTACLAAGKHVLVEKPIGLTRQRKAIQDLVELNAGATDPLTIAVGYNLRFHPLIVKLHSELKTYETPEAYYASFTCCQYTESPDALSNGCLETWACHEIDLAEHLCGPLRLIDHHVDGTSVNLGLARWEGPPCFVVIHSDMRARQRLRQVMVCTESRTHVIDLERNPVTDIDYRWELEAFVSRIHGDDDDTLASGEDGVAALRIAERASPGGQGPNRPAPSGSPPQQ